MTTAPTQPNTLVGKLLDDAQTTGEEQADEQRRQRLLTAQADRIAQLTEEIHARQQEVDDLKRQILDAYAPGSYTAGRLTVKIQAGRRTLKATDFQKAYPAAEHPECYRVQPLPLSQLERKLTDTVMADYTTTGRPTVSVS
ncbi:hypothetical protein [Bifidobacterium tissieri]|uniref:hypothetical protein n=1 Tax=Bifidobacterium tissieri TaxID=1630162 RepID=UPI00168B1ECF|nr:hypothetical protein [Bifidobacterium tissieri]